MSLDFGSCGHLFLILIVVQTLGKGDNKNKVSKSVLGLRGGMNASTLMVREQNANKKLTCIHTLRILCLYVQLVELQKTKPTPKFHSYVKHDNIYLYLKVSLSILIF